MAKQDLEAHRVTKPIQLLAAWLVGLISVDGSFLAAAKFISEPIWVPPLLVIAAIINVPLFLLCIFILQTRFRPEMQEDTFYSQYLEKRQITQTTEHPLDEIHLVRRQVLESNSRVLEFADNLQSQISTITEAVGRLAPGEDNIDERGVITRQLRERLEQAREGLLSTRKEAQWNQTSISVNDLLPTFGDIRDRLHSAGLKIFGTFGSNSEPPEKPSTVIVSVGKDVPIENIQVVLRLVADLGIEGISIISDSPFHSDDIIIGSYAFKASPFAPLDKGFLDELLTPNLTKEQFMGLVPTKYAVD